MQGIMLGLARAVQRWPAAVVGATVVVAAGLAFGIPRLEFQTGQNTLLDPGSKISRDNTRYQQQFGADPMLVLFEAPVAETCASTEGSDDCQRAPILQLFLPENQARLQQLEDELKATGDYHSIISPLAILKFAQVQIEQRMISEPQRLAEDEQRAMDEARAASAARGETAEQQETAAQEAKARVDAAFQAEFGPDAERFLVIEDKSLENPAFVEFVMYGADGELRPDIRGIFPDDHSALMVIRPNGNLSIDEGASVSAHVKDVVQTYEFEGVTALASGPPLLIKEINDGMKGAMTIMAVFAVVIMVAVLFAIFRARWRLLSLPAVLVGCVAAFGLMGFLGIPLTMVTISGLPILIGLGVDFAVQVHSRMEEETFAADSAERGIEATFLKLGPALGIAAVAACIGFIVLHLSDVPMIRDFGSMLAVGSVMVFVTSIALISGVLFLRERVRLGERALPQPRARIEVERLVGGLTSRTMGRLAPIAAVAVVVAAGGLWLNGEIPTESDPEKFVPSDSSVLKDLHHVRDVVGSTNELSILIELDDRAMTDQEVLDWLYAWERRSLEAHRELLRSNSIASFVAQISGADPTAEAAANVLATAPDDLVASVVADGASGANLRSGSMIFQIGGDLSLADQDALNEAIIDDAEAPQGVTVAPAGISVVGSASVAALSSNRELMSFVAVGAILLVLLVLFRSPVKAIAPMLPVVLALGASSMVFYVAGISYSPLTSISGPLIIAMGTEFSVLLMSRFFEEREAGLEAREAMSRASLRIGRAIAASGLTVMAGFAVLAFTDFPLLDNFGKVTAVSIGISLASTLILLPPLLVWADGSQRHDDRNHRFSPISTEG